MKRLGKYALLGIGFCIFNIGILYFLASPAKGKEHGAPVGHGAQAAESGVVTSGNSPSTKLIGAVQNGQSGLPGVIYAPRDVVDMTRLVLETSRDQTTHLAHYIEHATTVLVVFFTLLGAVGASVGLHKLNDIDAKAKAAMERFENDLNVAKAAAAELAARFKDNVDAADVDLRREIDDQIELVMARVEMEQSLKGPVLDNRGLTNAKKRLSAVLDRNQISAKGRIRGGADLAFILKRLGDEDAAYGVVCAASETASKYQPSSVPLLEYNAACYASLLDKQKEAIRHLKAAIGGDSTCKTLAACDEDFKNIKNTDEFKAMIA